MIKSRDKRIETVPNLVIFFLGYWIGNLIGIPKMCVKLSFSHYIDWHL